MILKEHFNIDFLLYICARKWDLLLDTNPNYLWCGRNEIIK